MMRVCERYPTLSSAVYRFPTFAIPTLGHPPPSANACYDAGAPSSYYLQHLNVTHIQCRDLCTYAAEWSIKTAVMPCLPASASLEWKYEGGGSGIPCDLDDMPMQTPRPPSDFDPKICPGVRTHPVATLAALVPLSFIFCPSSCSISTTISAGLHAPAPTTPLRTSSSCACALVALPPSSTPQTHEIFRFRRDPCESSTSLSRVYDLSSLGDGYRLLALVALPGHRQPRRLTLQRRSVLPFHLSTTSAHTPRSPSRCLNRMLCPAFPYSHRPWTFAPGESCLAMVRASRAVIGLTTSAHIYTGCIVCGYVYVFTSYWRLIEVNEPSVTCRDSSSMRTPKPKPKRTREELTTADSDYFFASDTDGGQPPGKKMRTRADGPAFVPEVQRVPEVQQGGGSKAAAKEAGETKAPKASANGHAVEKHVTFAGEYDDRPANNAEKVAARRRGMANIPRPQQLPEEAPEAPEELPIGHSRRQPTRRSARALLPPIVPPDMVIPTPVYMAAPPPQTHRTGTMYAVDGTGSPIGSVYSGNRGRSIPHYLVSDPASSSSAPLPSSSAAAGLPDLDDPSVTVTLQPEELRVIRDQLQSFQAMQRQIRHLEDQLRKGQK
ncbi:hypothetical protein R3P38DRAFT_3230835 [Favolaschia claudopus]|uniref:Uncharacterized protein n=1 Tax=Favolaschia claudopus TaxID=2862362 RepID=A0AAV9ZLU8_9AGAR